VWVLPASRSSRADPQHGSLGASLVLGLEAQPISGVAAAGGTGLQLCQRKKGHPGPRRRGFPSLYPFRGSAKPCPWREVPERPGVLSLPRSLSGARGSRAPSTPSLGLSGNGLSPATLHLRRLFPGPGCSQPPIQAPASVATKVSSSPLHAAIPAGIAPQQQSFPQPPNALALAPPMSRALQGAAHRDVPLAEVMFNTSPAKGGCELLSH